MCRRLLSLETPNDVQSVAKYSRNIQVGSKVSGIRLRVLAGWSETLLVAHTTLLEISCHGSNHDVFLSPNIVLTLTNSAEPDEMHLGLHCLQTYFFSGFPEYKVLKNTYFRKSQLLAALSSRHLHFVPRHVI